MKRYLVTGGAGFIGSHIVEALLGKGDFVRVLDNFDTGSRQNLPPASSRLELVEASLEDFGAIKAAMKQIDYVFHEAARGSVPRSVSDPLGTHNSNITGSLNILLAAKEEGVKRVICASSSSVYGETPTLPKAESMLPTPKSPYALSKLSMEYYARVFHQAYGLQTVSLRYFNVFGPRQNPNLQYAAVIPIFIRNMLLGKRCTIYGDGEQTRDFTYVEDCVSANLLATQADSVGSAVLNIACGWQTTVNQLFSLLAQLLHYHLEPVYQAARPGDVRYSYADIRKARQEFGFKPAFNLKQGLEKTVEWYRTSR